MLDNAASENNNSSFLGKDRLVVHGPDIGHNVNDQPWAFVRMEVYHVTQGAVCQCWTEYGYIIL